MLDHLDQVEDLDRVGDVRFRDELEDALVEDVDLFWVEDLAGGGVLLDEFSGLAKEALPDRQLLLERGPQEPVDRGQPREVVHEGAKIRVGRENLVQLLQPSVEAIELLALLLVQEGIEDGLRLLVAGLAGSDREIAAPRPLDLGAEEGAQDIDVLDYPLDVFWVEGERLLQVLEDADIVDDQPGLLPTTTGVLVGAVDTRDRLQEHVVTHRLVQVHAMQ